MKLLVTGGAGFIGSNFVRHVLATRADTRVVNLDKLTYAGNPANVADLAADPRHTFVKGDICDGALVREIARGRCCCSSERTSARSHISPFTNTCFGFGGPRFSSDPA